MTAKPWMPLYIADYLADTAHLGAAQSGAYLHLIMHYWQNGGLPEDEAALARIARMSPSEWKRNRPIIVAFFGQDWRHKRIDAELAHAADVSSKRRASAEEKHNKRRAIADANAEQLDTHARGLSQPQSQKKEAAQQSSTPLRASRKAEIDEIQSRLRDAAGLVDDPSPGLLDLSPMLTLIGKGYNEERDIRPVLKATAAAGKRGRTWRYYVPAIEEAKAKNDRIRAPPTSSENGARQAINWDMAVTDYERLGGEFLEGNGPGQWGYRHDLKPELAARFDAVDAKLLEARRVKFEARKR